jgi:hypothetical protein
MILNAENYQINYGPFSLSTQNSIGISFRLAENSVEISFEVLAKICVEVAFNYHV